MTKIVEKPWGQEIWIAHNNGHYLGKRIEINRGARLSLQKHCDKHETIFLHSGVALVTLPSQFEKRYICGSDSFEERTLVIPPGAVHRIQAVSKLILYEFSTNHPDDVIHLEDDYKRT